MVVDSWDCSHMCLSDLPREVWEHRATLRKLNMSSNAVKDIPKVNANACSNDVGDIPKLY